MRQNILVVTQWSYEEGLIQGYTLPYLNIIHEISPASKIYLITQEKKGLQKNKRQIDLIKGQLKKKNIYLLPEKYHRAGIEKYLNSALRFVYHFWFILFNNIRYIHAFCSPAGGYGYLLAKVTGRELIVDSYEPHSEYMREAAVWNEHGFPYRIMSVLEKKQAMAANHLILATKNTANYTEERFKINLSDYFVKPACVDLNRFRYDPRQAERTRMENGWTNKIVGVYAGKFGDFYLKEEIFEFFKAAFTFWSDKFHVLLLSDLKQEELQRLCHQFNLRDGDFSLMSVPHHMMPIYLSASDFAIAPYRPTPSKKFCTPIKNGEYWAMGLPVVITDNISVDSQIIDENDIGYVLKELNEEEYTKAVKKIESILRGNRELLREKIRSIAERYRSFSIAEDIYRHIYKN
jgi:glycosyltransferase involved in cell wall biosynthesis